MTTIFIEENSPQAKQLLEYIKTLPFATVIEEKKENFHEAAKGCNAVPAKVFTDELRRRIDQWTEDNA